MKNLLIISLLFVACNDVADPPMPRSVKPKDRILIKVDTAFNELRRIDSAAAYYTDLTRKAYEQMNSQTASFYGQMAKHYNQLYIRKQEAYIKNLK